MTSTKTFISWSGRVSHGVADELKKLLRLIFPSVDTFVSSADIHKGEQWFSALTGALARSQIGIICLTSGNFNQPWILFEVGALTRVRVYTILIGDLEPSLLEGSPLSQFQHTHLEFNDMLRLLRQINQELGESRRNDADLNELFGKLWPDMEKAVSSIVEQSPKKIIRIAALAEESRIIAGRVFCDSIIQGPAILAILEGNKFSTCVFDDALDSMWWNAPNDAIGAIGVSRCHFANCEFRGIGLTGKPEVLEALRKF